jgi:hypothetical protein
MNEHPDVLKQVELVIKELDDRPDKIGFIRKVSA